MNTVVSAAGVEPPARVPAEPAWLGAPAPQESAAAEGSGGPEPGLRGPVLPGPGLAEAVVAEAARTRTGVSGLVAAEGAATGSVSTADPGSMARCSGPIPDADAGRAASAAAVPVPASGQARLLLRALADPIRLQVVEALQHGERCVCELSSELDLAQSRLSFHLRVMKQAGLIRGRQEGRWIYYRLEPDALVTLQTWLAGLVAGCGTPASPCR